MLPPHRQLVHDLISLIPAENPHEQHHLGLVHRWIGSESPLYRTDEHHASRPHLCAYFVPFDRARNRVLLIDHIKARLWLPPGGHVEPHEDPRDTVRREAAEELGLDVEFHPAFGDIPLLVTITTTRPPSNCTDVTLWFIIAADENTALRPDPTEIRDVRWHALASRQHWETASDPHMPHFLNKLHGFLKARTG